MVIKVVITIDLSAPTTGTVETRLKAMPSTAEQRRGRPRGASDDNKRLSHRKKKLVSDCSECRKGTATIGIGKQTDNNGNHE